MKSVMDFNKDQKDAFAKIVSDFEGPSMTPYVLVVLESLMNTVAHWDDDIDPPKKLEEELEVCLSALEYFRMSVICEVKK
jgi:hypothetical protein